jgi:hypothetical protein
MPDDPTVTTNGQSPNHDWIAEIHDPELANLLREIEREIQAQKPAPKPQPEPPVRIYGLD